MKTQDLTLLSAITVLIISHVLLSGCMSEEKYASKTRYKCPDGSIVDDPDNCPEETTTTGYIVVNPCIGMPINLWNIPEKYFSLPKKDDSIDSPLSYGATIVGSIPDCKNIKVQVLDRRCSPIGIEYDYIKYGNQKGWVTRRLLTCPASKRDVSCDSAPDTICSYG